MSTRTQLIAAIKREARISNSTNLDPMVDDILNDVTRDYCNRAFNFELLQTNQAITPIAATGSYALPAGFFGLKEIRYGIGAVPTSMRQLKLRTPVVRRMGNTGYPFFYYLSAGPNLNIFPYSAIVSTDTLQIDYYVDPITLFTSGSANFPVPRLEAAVKKEVIMRLDKFHAEDQEAQMGSQDAASSFNASKAGTAGN